MKSRQAVQNRVGAWAVSVVLLIGLSTPRISAQGPKAFAPSANPVTDSVRNALAKQAKNLGASAELMPSDKYGYHPTPEQMTFGALIAHVVQTNVAICSAFTDAAPPWGPEELKKVSATESKDALVAAIRQSFDYCSSGISKLEDAALRDEALIFGRKSGLSRADALVTIAADWADHYSTAAGYLRLNGILPPTASPKR